MGNCIRQLFIRLQREDWRVVLVAGAGSLQCRATSSHFGWHSIVLCVCLSYRSLILSPSLSSYIACKALTFRHQAAALNTQRMPVHSSLSLPLALTHIWRSFKSGRIRFGSAQFDGGLLPLQSKLPAAVEVLSLLFRFSSQFSQFSVLSSLKVHFWFDSFRFCLCCQFHQLFSTISPSPDRAPQSKNIIQLLVFVCLHLVQLI